MENKLPLRIANILINALKGGVVPRIGLEYITVGRTQEIAAILHDIEMIEDGSASFRFIVGKYGSGKSFLLQTIRNYATAKGFAVVDADLSPERRFAGTKGQGLATYKELIQNLSTKSKPDGGALPLILEKWISGIQASIRAQSDAEGEAFNRLVEKQIYAVAGSLEGMVNGFEFAKAVAAYWRAYQQDDAAMKSNVLKWFRGEYASRKEAKADLDINFIVTDETWYDFLKLFAAFLVNAGYKGLLVFIDELVNIYKIPNSITRQNNYEKILTMYNDVLQGKAKHIGFLIGGTPQCIEDKYKGMFSYEALRSRLAEGHFATDEMKDLTAPIIRLQMLTQEEVYVLVEKLRDIHAQLYNYTPTMNHEDLLYFLTVEYNRVGAGTHITPREIIRDFIELVNILHQNPNRSVSDILGSNSFEMAKGGLSDETIHSDFLDFEV
ncbi:MULTISPECIES: ATP-binding protein [Clostridia]|uniref:ATP-binding protein n=1 Tax=Clostridia TaxID=186801 RepID=UPI0012B32CC6|nr:ATP-binding protein [Clostridium sp. WB02_MRS01]MBW4845319.1 ATP-binding protein [Lachnospiraceae bacterium]MSS09689.1 AAA family ATPase [Clostridium sp. WB02_MRS01]